MDANVVNSMWNFYPQFYWSICEVITFLKRIKIHQAIKLIKIHQPSVHSSTRPSVHLSFPFLTFGNQRKKFKNRQTFSLTFSQNTGSFEKHVQTLVWGTSSNFKKPRSFFLEIGGSPPTRVWTITWKYILYKTRKSKLKFMKINGILYRCIQIPSRSWFLLCFLNELLMISQW